MSGNQVAAQSIADASSSSGSSSALSQRPQFSIQCWQPRSQPLLFTGVLTLYATVVFAVYWFTRDVLMTGVTVTALLLVSWRLWIPVRFHIGPTGVIQSVLGQQRQLGWGYVKQIQPHRGGLRVLYQTAGSELSLRKTLVISVPQSKLEELVTTFEYYMLD